MPEYEVWTCKIVVLAGAVFPEGFDYPPRRAAIDAIESHGIVVVGCFSGWAGDLTDTEKAVLAGDKPEETDHARP